MTVLEVAYQIHRWGWLVTAVGVLAVIVGVAGMVLSGRRGKPEPSEDEFLHAWSDLDEVVYEPGVAQVGERP